MPPARKDSTDSLDDPNYPTFSLPSGSRGRRGSASSQSSDSISSSDDESGAWTSQASGIHRVVPTPPSASASRPLVSPSRTSPARPGPGAGGLSPARPPMSAQPGSWGVSISPNHSYKAPQPRSSHPSPIAPVAEASSEDEDDLPAFSAPAPARFISPPKNGAPASGSGLRPPLGTTPSSLGLLGDSSAANTPMSAISDPFNDRKQASSLPQPTGYANDQRGAPPPFHINVIPNTPQAPEASIIGAPAPPSTASPLGTARPQYDGHYTQPISQTNDPVAQQMTQRRASHATAASTHHSISGISVTSALDNHGNKLTAAERRNLRMKQVVSKKGKREGKSAGGVQVNRQPFKSTRLKEEIYKPWLEKKDPAQRWARWITLFSIFLGLVVMGVICWDGYNSVPRLGNICPVLNEDWSNGIDPAVWTREVRVDGYGHGSFDYTTASPNNSFVQDKTLYLVPTLTSDVIGEAAISNGYTLNLTADGTCTSTNVSQCVAVSNSSQLTVINPVMSARLTTRMSMNIRYGKVEVVAKFPTGDWLYPSIAMFPVNETYGKSPRSGSIDIITGRGNNASYSQRGVDYAQSDLHWGPTTELDRMWMTWGYREQRRSAYNQGYRTFGFEWNENYLWTYIDSRVAQVVSLRFDQSFWNRGKFPSTITNTTTGDVIRLVNPWINSQNNNAPFDQPFYLSLSLAVGATDGWFPDGEGGKPWLDNSLSAMSDFWNAKNKWWNAWPSDPTVRGFGIKSVKMWRTC